MRRFNLLPYHSTAYKLTMPTASPFVSVIIPAYNAGDTVRRCVESVLSQTFTDIEVIVVDDGSRDDTLAVLRQMQKEDARLVVHHQENAGVSAARNAGLALASGWRLSTAMTMWRKTTSQRFCLRPTIWISPCAPWRASMPTAVKPSSA